jgi:hypothetical protein
VITTFLKNVVARMIRARLSLLISGGKVLVETKTNLNSEYKCSNYKKMEKDEFMVISESTEL